MLGLGDFWVFLGYILTISSMLLCVGYGIWNWNNPKEDTHKEIMEENTWESRDPEMGEGGVQ